MAVFEGDGMKRVALYLRVSTDEQTIDNQRLALEEIAQAHSDWQVVASYADEGISGSKGRNRRPGFDRLVKDAIRRKFDLVAAVSVDRLGRSLQDLVAFLAEIRSAGVDLYLHKQAIDTSTPAGKALFQMIGVFSEFEVEMIRERTRAGLVRARASGKRLGRPRLIAEKAAAVRQAIKDGVSIRRAARNVGVSVSSVQRIKAIAPE
jgi:DNA invertase Pin-like site-specific DNA recombinase